MNSLCTAKAGNGLCRQATNAGGLLGGRLLCAVPSFNHRRKRGQVGFDATVLHFFKHQFATKRFLGVLETKQDVIVRLHGRAEATIELAQVPELVNDRASLVGGNIHARVA